VKRSLTSRLNLVVAALSAIFAISCSDVVTTRFSTLADAKAQRAFERGWLPPMLPESAKNIEEKNNLDLNTGNGSFEYTLSERADYIERLTGAGALLRVERETAILILNTNGSTWEIQLPPSAGIGSWSIKPMR
jgi:hypothetical protein